MVLLKKGTFSKNGSRGPPVNDTSSMTKQNDSKIFFILSLKTILVNLLRFFLLLSSHAYVYQDFVAFHLPEVQNITV